MRRPLNVGLVVGAAEHLAIAQAIDDDPHASLSIVCDESPPERVLRRAPASGVTFTRQYSDLIEDESIDAVVIAVPRESRAQKVSEALDADKHVLVFGVLAPTLVEADELVRVAARRGRHLVTHHPGRTRIGVRRLRSLLDRGALGEIQYLEILRSNSSVEHGHEAAVWDLVADAVALTLDLLGDQPIDVAGPSESYGGPETGVFRASLLFATGISAHLALTRLDARELDRVTVVGETITAELESTAGAEVLSLFAPAAGSSAELSTPSLGDGSSLQSGDVLKQTLPTLDPLRTSCEQFVAGIRTRFEPEPGRGAAAVVGALELLQRLQHVEPLTQQSTPHASNVVTLPSW